MGIQNLMAPAGLRIARLMLVALGLMLVPPHTQLSGQSATTQNSNPRADSDQDPAAGDQAVSGRSESLEAQQKILAENYRLLEEKLFTLHEFEKGTNPPRSKLLERAFRQSQSKMTAAQMRKIVSMLEASKLKEAEKEQQRVLTELNSLLNLLQSEDRGKRIQDAIQRHQAYLKEVERILRIQKGIRGQAEGGVDRRRLEISQGKTADRAKELGDEIHRNEESDVESDKDLGPENDDDASSGAHPTEQPQPGLLPQPSPAENQTPAKDTTPKSGDQSSPATQPGEAPPHAPKLPENPNDAPPKEAAQEPENPTRSRVMSAEQRMRKAKQNLESARRQEAIEDMQLAEREMALAKKELEEILRQLREEEVERTLGMLEGRFRQMLEREIRVHDATVKLDRTQPQQRGTEFEIKAAKLGLEQNSIATEAARALMVLQEDGSSVAFPATVDEMHQDMIQVAKRLSAAKVGRVSIEIESDIIDSLEYLIRALVQTQEDVAKSKQSQQQARQSKPGDQPLVDQLAELKMLRGLQERILRRHTRYSRLLENPEDQIGVTDDPDLRSALRRLSEKQAKLTEIASDIVNEKNK